jgi:hypothetical protein
MAFLEDFAVAEKKYSVDTVTSSLKVPFTGESTTQNKQNAAANAKNLQKPVELNGK